MKKVFIALLLGITCLMGCSHIANSETPKRFEYVEQAIKAWNRRVPAYDGYEVCS